MKKNSIDPQHVQVKAHGPYKVNNPLDTITDAWFYRMPNKIEVALRTRG